MPPNQHIHCWLVLPNHTTGLKLTKGDIYVRVVEIQIKTVLKQNAESAF